MTKKVGKKTNIVPELKSQGLKTTPARVAILEMLQKSKKPLSVQKILKGLISTHTDQATVYRTVEHLRKAGLIRRVDLEHGHAHYELNSSEHHHHIVCENCGRLEDISKCDIPGLEKEILKTTGFAKVNSHSLEFFGLCSKCAK